MVNIKGKLRPITHYSKSELSTQRALLRQLSPVLEQQTHPSVFSYRPGTSALKAAQMVARHIQGYQYFVRLDVKDFFPSVNRALLGAQLETIMCHKLKKAVMDFACASPSGLAEGSPLSPALSNIYLAPFDKAVSDHYDGAYVRFSDDMVILVDSRPAAVTRFVTEELNHLSLKPNINKIEHGNTDEGFDFLGYHISKNQFTVTEAKVTAIVQRIQSTRGTRREQIIKGWWAYNKDARLLPESPESALLLSYSGRSTSARKLALRLKKRTGERAVASDPRVLRRKGTSK
jgi:hypothetical protein